MRPQSDDYPEHIERAIHALLSSGVGAGARALEPIAYPPRVVPRRPTVSRAIQGRIFVRDHFECRYCGGKVIPTPIMELLGGFYPQSFPFQSPNWKGGVTHPAIISRSPLVDHVQPGSIGGAWLDEDNLATACNPCNSIKADFTLEQIGWILRPISTTAWRGLTESYRPLWELAGQPKPNYHQTWITALHCE